MLELFTRFEGRIDRGQWWRAQGIIAAVVLPVLAWLWLNAPSSDPRAFLQSAEVNAVLLMAMVAGIAPTVKRYHDLNRSGWWALLAFVPVASFWLLYECGFRTGDSAPNRFDVIEPGAEPKAQPAWMFF